MNAQGFGCQPMKTLASMLVFIYKQTDIKSVQMAVGAAALLTGSQESTRVVEWMAPTQPGHPSLPSTTGPPWPKIIRPSLLWQQFWPGHRAVVETVRSKGLPCPQMRLGAAKGPLGREKGR